MNVGITENQQTPSPRKVAGQPITLFWVSGSPYSWRVLLALEVKALAYESRLLTKAEGGLEAPALAKINSRRTVPTLLHGDLVLTDSIAILAYLDWLAPQPALFGTTACASGEIWERVFNFTNHVEPFSKSIVKAFYAGDAEERRKEIADNAAIVRTELARIENFLTTDWLVGTELSATDLVTYPFLKSFFRAAARPEAQSHNLGVLPVAEHYPRIAAWMALVEALPGYAHTYPPNWK